MRRVVGRGINRLTPRFVASVTEPGRYADGAGLYLMVRAGGSKSWVMRYWQGDRRSGRRTDLGLGSVVAVTLATARQLAADIRADLGRGLDPRERRRASAAVPTFGAADVSHAGLPYCLWVPDYRHDHAQHHYNDRADLPPQPEFLRSRLRKMCS